MGRSVRIALKLLAALGAVAAPALAAQMALVQGAHSQTYQAPALPPPPYAAGQRAATSYGGPQTYDRYGGGSSHARVQAAGVPQAAAYAGPRLGWTGKTETAQASRMAQPIAHPVGSWSPAGYAPPQAQIQPQPPAPAGWTYVPPIGERPVEPAPLPTSIYDAPPPAAAPPTRQVASTGGPRHYSLHSEFGIRPDPIPPPGQVTAGATADPLPSSFFAANPDLSQPETPEPSKKLATASGKSRNAVQPEGGQ